MAYHSRIAFDCFLKPFSILCNLRNSLGTYPEDSAEFYYTQVSDLVLLSKLSTLQVAYSF